MNAVERQSGTKNATILMIFAGGFHLYLGYTIYLYALLFQLIVGSLMIVFGGLAFCISLIVWFEKPWATKAIAVVGFAACVVPIPFGYQLMIIIIGPFYWFAIKWIRPSQPTEIPDWAPDWNED